MAVSNRDTLTPIVQKAEALMVRNNRGHPGFTLTIDGKTVHAYETHTLLSVAIAGALVAILHAGVWHHHLLRFLYRTWEGFLVQVGSTPSGFIRPIIVSVVSIAGTLLCIGYLYGRAAMKRHCWETAAITSVVFATVMLLVYSGTFYFALT